MISLLQTLQNKWRQSLVTNTSIKIAMIGCCVVLIFSMFSFYVVRQLESQHARDHIAQLVPTVESTVRIACYLKDKRLADEIARGLMSNRAVAAVRISAFNEVLAEINPGDLDFAGDSPHIFKKSITSIVDSESTIGEFSILADQAYIQSQANSYSGLIAFLLGLAVICATMLIGYLVFLNILRPIQRFSDNLHALQPQAIERLNAPATHQEDELGRLADDFNSLIDKAAALQRRELHLSKQVEQNDRKFRALAENSVIGLFEIDASGDLISSNSAFFTIFHIPEARKEELHLLNLKKLMPTDTKRIGRMIERVTQERLQQKQEFEMISRISKTISWIQVILEPSEHGLIQGLVHDISENRKKAQETQSMVERDALTGAYNRRGMIAKLDEVFDAFKADKNKIFTIMLIDLDWFKEVNDNYGHDAGDIVLCIVTRRLKSILRDDDSIARIGGDEFLLILPTLTQKEWATQLGERIISALMSEMDIGEGRLVKVGASIGIATSTAKDTSMDGLLKRADAAMYSAKHAGKCQLSYSEH